MKWFKPLNFYLSCFVLGTLALGYAVVWYHHPYREIAKLETKWGKKRYSQFFEELFIRDYFQDKKQGFFVDVGANHYKINSTTFYLEKHLGWHGLAIDHIAKFEDGYKKNRPNTTYLAYCISDKPEGSENFYQVLSNPRLSSSKKGAVEGFPFKKVKVPTTNLNALFAKYGIKEIDFLSIDVELSEIEVLAGFDIEKYRPKLVCIEAHSPVQKEIHAYFKAHHYVKSEKYSYLDHLNVYYIPAKVAEKF